MAAIKAANAAVPDDHDYSEEETRDRFIDLLLKEAGWPLDQARAFLRQHQDNPALLKLRRNQRLTADDLAELDRLLSASGAGTAEEIATARQQSNGLAAFVRSLVGMDREAAKAAFAGFAAKLSGNQNEFVNLVIDHLTEFGVIDAGELYDSPFTDVAPKGPDALFPAELMGELVAVLGGLQAV